MKTSIDHLPETKRRELQAIATLLRNEFDAYLAKKSSLSDHNQIEKIILFGSHAKGTWVDDPENGYISDYDILLLLSEDTLVEEYALWNKAEEKIQRSITVPLSLIIHSLPDVSNQLMKGHYFFKEIREQGIELYNGNNKPLREPGNLTAEEQKEIAEKHYEQWFNSAKSFVIDYGHCMDRKDLKKAAFELHQAAERFYSCALLVHTNYKPKTHSLSQLRTFCTNQDPRFQNTFLGNNQFNRRSFQRLKRAYIDARYSEHFEITEEELEWLAGEVETLKGLVEESCRQRIDGFSNVGCG